MKLARILSTAGGQLALVAAVFVIGAAMTAARLPKGEDVMTAALGAILMAATARWKEGRP